MDLGRIPHVRPARLPESPAFRDPDFIRAADWLARAPSDPALVVLGAPFGGGSISRARCDLTPAAIRQALERFSVWSSDRAISLEPLDALDAGDVEPDSDVEKTQERIAEAVGAAHLETGAAIALIGGDNSVTVGGARGVEADGLLTFDAHHDCRDPAHGVTNGSVVRQLVEGGLTNVSQIGIHGYANAEAHARWALEHNVHVVSADRVRGGGIGKAVAGGLRFLGNAKRIWVDFDMDVLDRAFAPGAPAAMPGGLQPHELDEAAFLLGKDRRVSGIDITEVDPERDISEVTVRAACSVLLSFCIGVASR
ncbi:MAG TPA: agmatinase family protein [Actinomycetota bacterium]|nr:agmatinase family protein [Actinomycetota bacterium]